MHAFATLLVIVSVFAAPSWSFPLPFLPTKGDLDVMARSDAAPATIEPIYMQDRSVDEAIDFSRMHPRDFRRPIPEDIPEPRSIIWAREDVYPRNEEIYARDEAEADVIDFVERQHARDFATLARRAQVEEDVRSLTEEAELYARAHPRDFRAALAREIVAREVEDIVAREVVREVAEEVVRSEMEAELYERAEKRAHARDFGRPSPVVADINSEASARVVRRAEPEPEPTKAPKLSREEAAVVSRKKSYRSDSEDIPLVEGAQCAAKRRLQL